MTAQPLEVAEPKGLPPSERARLRMQRPCDERMFLADWREVLMLHFAVPAQALQGDVPFALDLHDGHAFVSLVAFKMQRMRPHWGGKFTQLLFAPIATHEFLNVRTYVTVNGEPGIHFLAEWLTSRLAVALGPRMFSLPYRFGRIRYHNDWRRDALHGSVACPRKHNRFAYAATLPDDADFAPCEPGSRDEWLMERYAAFNSARGRHRFFRVWHPPWPQCSASVTSNDISLLKSTWPWFVHAKFAGANYSPGLREVWMGRPHRL